MKRFFLAWIITCCAIHFGPSAAADQPSPQSSFREAQELERNGKEIDAFRIYLTVPGAEYAAISIARSNPGQFLVLLKKPSTNALPHAVHVVEGDLLIGMGKRDSALASYRQAAVDIRKVQRKTDSILSSDYYPVDPPQDVSPDSRLSSPHRQALAPFSLGPGSHRDNWLIRRFIALEAWDDAQREFDRMWAIYETNIEPYVVSEPVIEGTNIVRQQEYLITPVGFDGVGLQFLIDYAYFLKRQGQSDKALYVLFCAVARMDIDKNLNLDHRRDWTPISSDDASRYRHRPAFNRSHFPFYWGVSSGISRKEFIRLTYGEFKAAGKEKDLLQKLEEEISRGNNQARRILARVYEHQGKISEAITQELDYIEKSNFPATTAAYRRGLVYEELQEPEKAVAEYESLQRLPDDPTTVLPDPDEDVTQNAGMWQAIMPLRSLDATPDMPGIRLDSVKRLIRIYSALGRTDKVLEAVLRQFILAPSTLENIAAVDAANERFKAVGQKSRFDGWLHERLSEARSPTAQATINWILKDYKKAAIALAESVRGNDSNSWILDSWKERFAREGKDKLKLLLSAILEVNPKDARSRLELLDLEGQFKGADAIKMLELLLDSDASFAFARGKGARNRTQFHDYFDLAYRLMRLYEKSQVNEDKLVALGFRVLDGMKPFERKPDTLAKYRADWNDSVVSEESHTANILQCLYLLFSHLKSPADIERAAAQIEKTGSIPLINQINRLRRGDRPRITPITGKQCKHESVRVRTLGIPQGVRVLANRDDVRAIAPGAQWGGGKNAPGRIWIGTSWGLVRYKEEGKAGGALEILQIPMGTCVSCFTDTPAGLYVGTRDGLFRLDNPYAENPSLVRISAETADGKQRDRVERYIERDGSSREERVHESFPVDQLLWWTNRLWVCSREEIYSYDPEKQQSRHFGRWGGLMVGAGHLWATRAVYDSQSGEFHAIESDWKEWHMIGATEREGWADVWINDKIRHRPAIVDPATFRLTVLPINDPTGSGRLLNSDFRLLGVYEDCVWLAGDNPGITVAYDRSTHELRVRRDPVPDTAPWIDPSRAVAAVGLDLRGDRGPRLSATPLTDGRLLVANAIVREWREDNLGFDDNCGMSMHVQDLEGGLFEIDLGAKTWRKIGADDEELSDFYVKRIRRHGNRLYLCTNGGVTILSFPDGRIIGRITVSDGLPSNKVEDVARIGNKLYFACELGDEKGGLAVQDLDTGPIQVLIMADGLKSNKIKQLRADGNKLHILYGTIYGVRAYGTPQDDSITAPVPEETERHRHRESPDNRVRTFRSSILDTVSGIVGDGSEVLPAAFPPEALDSPLPILGGTALFRDREAYIAHPENPKFIAGTHGLIMITGAVKETAMQQTWSTEQVGVVKSHRQQQLEGAMKRPMDVTALADLKTAFGDRNAFYRARAVATLLGRETMASNCVPELVELLDDPEMRVRSTTLFMLNRLGLEKFPLDAVARRLDDTDVYIRAYATIVLCQHGHVPNIAFLRDIVKTDSGYGNFPFGPSSSVGVVADRDMLYTAVAPYADTNVFELFMESSITTDNYEPRQKVFKALGEVVKAQPGTAMTLLRAYTRERDPGPESNYGAARFAQEVFWHAGPPILPTLHNALKDKDRVIRSNAARACGAIKDSSSIEPLMNALDLESGLSRASIVWALGELKVKEALPKLVDLYVDARNDEQRKRGAGFRMAQAAAAIESHYSAFRNLDSIGSEWNELKQEKFSRSIDLEANEWLLSTEIILAAVRKIGPDASQEFYRTLAAGKDTEARRQAAQCLTEGNEADHVRNISILRNMLADEDMSVRIRAAVSLLILNDDVGKEIILLYLKGDRWQNKQVLDELGRIQNSSCLSFAEHEIAAITKRIDDDSLQKLAVGLLKRLNMSAR